MNVLSLNGQTHEEYNTQMKVYDVRDPDGAKDGIFLIGGFAGEMIITFTCLLDYILANPQHQHFMFGPETFEEFLKDLLLSENFADGILTLNVAHDPDQPQKHENSQGEIEQTEPESIDDEEYMRRILERENISDYGLGFFFDVNKDLVISRNFIEILYRIIVKNVRTKAKEIQSLPEAPVADAEGNEPSEEAKAEFEKKTEAINKENAEAELFNEALAKIKSKIRVNQREHVADGANSIEGALVRLNNFRE